VGAALAGQTMVNRPTESATDTVRP